MFSELFEGASLLIVGLILCITTLFFIVHAEELTFVPFHLISAIPVLSLNLVGALEVSAGLIIIALCYVAWREEDIEVKE